MRLVFRLFLLAVLITAIVLFNVYELGQYLTLEYINQQLDRLRDLHQAHPIVSIAVFMGAYALLTALSIPSAAVLTVLSGAIFGWVIGTLASAVAATIGATLAFLSARFLLRDWISGKYPKAARQINDGVDRDGAFYLLSLRLTPIFPFFVINVVMGLTRMKTALYALVSLVGMIPGTAIFVNAGKELAQIESLGDILSPAIIGSLTLVAIAPFVFRGLFRVIQTRRKLSGFDKPRSFDNDLVIVGAGSAGLVTAAIAAALNAKATLIERDEMGGDCLNTGCVPSKSLIRSGRLAYEIRHAADLGLIDAKATVDFPAVLKRVHEVIATIAPHDSRERFESLGVNTVAGDARLVSPWAVEVNGETITGRKIVLATGGRPFVPPLDGLDQIEVLTSDNLWQLETLPEQLVIIGGGPIGCEMAQAFARLGSKVTVVEMADRILGNEDPKASELIEETMTRDGVDIRTGLKATSVEAADGGHQLMTDNAQGESVALPFDRLLIAIGRKANSENLGLDELRIERNNNGTLVVNDFLQTTLPTVYACGDLIGPWQFTHSASHEAWYCAVNALFSPLKRFRADYRVMPRVTFTSPEVASVGVTEQECIDEARAHQVTDFPLDKQDRALAEGAAVGFVRIITEGNSDTIIGAHIVAAHAGEMLNEFTIAMKHKLGLNKLLAVTHPYPTWSEANKSAATEWKRNNAPQWALGFLQKFFSWRRG